MVGQCHQSDQHEFNPTPGGSGRQEGLVCSGSWGHEESDMTKQLNRKNMAHIPSESSTGFVQEDGSDLSASYYTTNSAILTPTSLGIRRYLFDIVLNQPST